MRATIIYLAILCGFPQVAFARDYVIKMTPCLIGSNCNKCAEVISLKYDVDSKNKLVAVSGLSINGEPIKETLNSCDIKDGSNWSCSHSAIMVSAKDGLISVATNKKSSLYASKKEMCLVK